jgi:hypothetical protein
MMRKSEKINFKLGVCLQNDSMFYCLGLPRDTSNKMQINPNIS